MSSKVFDFVHGRLTAVIPRRKKLKVPRYDG